MQRFPPARFARKSAVAAILNSGVVVDAGALRKADNLSDLGSAATARTNLGLGTAATHATGDYDAAGAAAAAQAASQPLDSDLTAIAALSTTSYGRAFLALADAAAARTALSLGTAATHATGDYEVAGAAAAALAKFKSQRVTTGSIAGASTALVTLTWTAPFADANYTVQASVVEATASSLSLSVVHVESYSASAVTVRIINNAVGALTGELHLLALHD